VGTHDPRQPFPAGEQQHLPRFAVFSGAEGLAFTPRSALGSRDARTLAREPLMVTQKEFSRAFEGSPMKSAKLRGLERNAAVLLGNDVRANIAARREELCIVRASLS
jgi:epoxyqueuosine reductase QueG